MKTRLLLAALLGLAALGACSSTPDEPTFDNPFDPDSDEAGDGYGLAVEAEGDSVVMTWTNLPGVLSYRVYWSDTSANLEDMTLISGSDPLYPPDNTPRVEFTHRDFTAEETNWYRLVGRAGYPSDSGDSIKVSMIASDAVALEIQVLVVPVGDPVSTPTRFIDLKVLTGVADSIELANVGDFSTSTVEAVTPGMNTTVPWTLPTVSENREDLWVHFRSRSGGGIGAADSFAIQARFEPSIFAVRGLRTSILGQFVADTLQTYLLSDEPGQIVQNVSRYRVEVDSLVLVEDITPASAADSVFVHWDPAEPLVDGEIVATLQSDFGFSEEASLDLRIPSELGDPEIKVLEGDVVTTRDIQVISTCRDAGYILLSEDPNFTGATWVAWADTLDFQLENTAGARFLFAAFTNPILAETRVTSTPVTLVFPPAPHRR